MDEHLLKTILNSVKPTTGYCAIRKNLVTEKWWLDPETFSLLASECRQKVHKMSLKNSSCAEFDKKNPALLIQTVEVKPI